MRGGLHVAAVPQPPGCVREYQGLFWAQLRAGTLERDHLTRAAMARSDQTLVQALYCRDSKAKGAGAAFEIKHVPCSVSSSASGQRAARAMTVDFTCVITYEKVCCMGRVDATASATWTTPTPCGDAARHAECECGGTWAWLAPGVGASPACCGLVPPCFRFRLIRRYHEQPERGEGDTILLHFPCEMCAKQAPYNSSAPVTHPTRALILS